MGSMAVGCRFFYFSLLVLNVFIIEITVCENDGENGKGSNSNLWEQLMGIIKHAPDAPLEIKNLVNNKQLDAQGRQERICDTPCENGGSCVAKDVCRCINAWSGPTCTLFECTEPCLNGICRGPDTCFCDSGWTGNTCSKPICNPSCMNKGQCAGANECRCADGYVGQRCQDATCDPPCAHGNCYKPNQCTCDPGWQGPLCTEPSCSHACENEGECTRPNQCTCSPEWRGYFCEIPICKSRCQNGGTCVAPNECKCPPKFVGEYCQVGLDREAHGGQTCTVWSSYHFRTFDGHAFDFPGLCRYDLAKDVRDGLFSIQLVKSKEAFTGGGYNSSKAISNMVRNYTSEFMAVTLSIRGTTSTITLLPEKMFMVDDKLISDRQFSYGGVSVEAIGRYLRVKTRLGISILWDGEGVADIELENGQYHGGLGGLCGNFDSDPYNDRVMRDGSPADPLFFAMAWRVTGIHEDCTDITDIPDFCSGQTPDQNEENQIACEVLMNSLASFRYCRDRGVDPTPFADACVRDMCKCKKENKVECSCNALTQYSRLCVHETGIAPKWRRPNLCGMECPVGMVYDECASSCPRTCQSLVTPETDCDEHCVDGCACVNGTVRRHDNVCVPEEECPCIHGDLLYVSGHVIKQNCLECQCNGALWNCKNLQCPGECSVVGASHSTTFDGLLSKIYGECQFTFVKDCSETNLFSVVVENSLCANDLSETCVNDVLVMLSPISSGPSTSRTTNGEHEIQIRLGRNGRVTVGDQSVVLPSLTEHFQIFQVSSEFIHLNLNLGITLEWNGASRLYVNAERKWMGKLCGICGNFNDNKRDDMMNFNGLVEKSATAFSNLWKVNTDCRDASTDLNLDACVVNPQKAQFAKEKCSVIRGNIFQKCHAFVNPAEAETTCRQDVCQCDEGASCLCNAIAHYARQCTHKGQIVRWRTDEFCPVVCTGGQTFQQCGSSCLNTCRSISDPRARCSETCMEGCNCPPDMYLNEYRVCVPRAQCQCYHNGNVHQPFFTLRREFTICHCRDGLFTCQSSELNVLKSLPKVSAHNSSDCQTGWAYYSCGNGFDLLDRYPQGIECQRTCRNLDTRCIATECVEGCGCPKGLVLDTERNACMHQHQCPCYYSGQAHYPGEVVKVDCNKCTCHHREWNCTEEPCVGTCTAYGDPHFQTFDGYKYDFMGQCGYIMTQDFCGNHDGKFRVHVESTNCGSDGVSCAKSVTVTLTGSIYIKMTKDTFGYDKKELVTWGVLHGSPTNGTSVLWDFYNVGLFTIVTTNIGLTVAWDRKTTLYVKLHPQYKGRVCGLCGDFDDNQNNDMMMSDHMLAIHPTEFGNSWKVTAACADAIEKESQCNKHPQRRLWAQRSCKVLYDPVFTVCHSVVDVVWYHANCVFDACSCDTGGDCECLCTAIAAYAHACSEEGVKIRWRTDKVCPLMCEAFDENIGDCTWHYNECSSACPDTCQHLLLADEFNPCPLSISCVEGCFPNCPDGEIFDEESMSCVSVCRDGCHLNAKYYEYGQIVNEDADRVCICQQPRSIVCSARHTVEYREETTSPGKTTESTSAATTSQLEFSSPTSYPWDILDWSVTWRYCSGTVNLGFLVDGSHHVSANDFENVKTILEEYVGVVMPNNYGTRDTTLKVGIAQYGDEYEEIMNFESEQSIASLSSSVVDMELQNAKPGGLSVALNRTLENYKTQIEKETSDDKLVKIDNVLFIVMFSAPDGESLTHIHALQEIGVRIIVLSAGNGPSEISLRQVLGKTAPVYYVSDVIDFMENYDMRMEVLEEICEGETYFINATTAPTKIIATTQAPTTTTSVFVPDEACTMKADLVIIIDAQLLKNTEEENRRFLLLLKSILSETLVRPDRTHVTILLSDSRIWRVGRFISTREQLLGEFEEILLTKIRTKVFETTRFDINFALETALDGYLLNKKSGVRLLDLNVHKSILIFHERPGYLPDSESWKSLSEKLGRIDKEEIVLNIITQKGTFESKREKNAWREAIKTKNLLFADIYQGDITQTRFNRIMERVCRTPPNLPMEKIFCDGHTDVYFLWDDSDTISSTDLKNMLRATGKIANSLRLENFGSNEQVPVRISIAQYSTSIDFLLEIHEQHLLKSFIKEPLSNVHQWNLGEESNLGNALTEVANRFKQLSIPRNKTVVIFTSRKSTDDLTDALESLEATGVRRLVIGFAPDTNTKELSRIAGENGFYRRIASSREILDSDLGMAIAEEICIPTELMVQPTSAPVETTVPVARTVQSTKFTPSIFQTSPDWTLPACAMSSDLLMIIDSHLTSETTQSNLTFSVLRQIIKDLEIGDDVQTTRVGIMVVGQKPSIVSNIEKEGNDKQRLLDSLIRVRGLNGTHSLSPFSLVKAIQMANDFVFPPEEEKVKSQNDILLITDRLPENELNEFLENTLESVKNAIQDLIEDDINVYMLYTKNTFNMFSSDERKEWLMGLRERSFLLEENDDPELLGNEILDTICSVPTRVTTLTPRSMAPTNFTKQTILGISTATSTTRGATELHVTSGASAGPTATQLTPLKPFATSPPATSAYRTETSHLTFQSSTLEEKPTAPYRGCFMDLEIIVDSSYSIGPDFSHIKIFLADLVDELEIASDVVRVGLIQYSGNVTDEFKMSDFISNSTGMKTVISDMHLLLGTTNTFTAMDYVLDNKISKDAGKRDGVPLIILLLSDGRIKDSHKKEEVLRKFNAQRASLSEAGTFLNMMAIGFGSANQNDLLQIADSGMYLEKADDFSQEEFTRNISSSLCIFKPRQTAPVMMPTTTVSTTPTTPLPVCGNIPATDILFVLDGSFDMLGTGRVEAYRDFLKQMASKFRITPRNTQIGVSLYSDGVYREYPNGFGIRQFEDSASLQEAISNLELTSRMAYEAIESLSLILSRDFPPRAETRKVAVILLSAPGDGMDGKTMEDVFREATDQQIEIVLLIGSGSPEMDMDIGLSVGPTVQESNRIMIDGGILQMSSITDQLMRVICQELPMSTTVEERISTIFEPSTTPAISTTSTRKQAEITTSSPGLTTISAESCSVVSDTLLVLDDNIFSETLGPEGVVEYLSRIKSAVKIHDTLTHLEIFTTPSMDNWKPLGISDLTKPHTTSEAKRIDIGETIGLAIDMFDDDVAREDVKRQLILILKTIVNGTITTAQWKRMEQLQVTMIVISINSKFLQTGAPEFIPFYEIPISSVEYLPLAAISTIEQLCLPISTTPGISTTSLPQLVCPPGDVVIMYDAMFLTPQSERKLKQFLKNLINLLSNTYTYEKTRFSLVTFGNTPEMHFNFSATRTPAQVNRLVDQSTHTGERNRLNAATALNFVVENIIGSRPDNNHVTQTIMMLMARPSNENLIPVIEAITGKVDLITIAVGYSEPNLERFTTVLYGGLPARDVDHLKNLEYETLELICSVQPKPTTTPTTPWQPITEPKHPCKVDVIFMLDEKLLSSARSAESTKKYVNRIAKYLVFGSEFFRINVKKFSEASTELVVGGFAENLAELQRDLNANLAISPATGSLNLRSGLEDAVVELDAHGRTGHDVARIVIFVLRRRSTNVPNVARMNKLRDEGVMVFSVVTDDAMFIPRSSLSNHRQGYIRAYRPQYLPNFASVIVYFLWNAVCYKRPSVSPPVTTTTPTASAVPGVCYRIMDITYIVDSKLLVDQYEKENIQHFIKDTIRAFDLGVQTTRISLIKFDSVAHPVISLRSVYNIKDAFKAIDSKLQLPDYYRPVSLKSYVSSSLSFAAKHILRPDGVRDAEKFIVLITKNEFGDEYQDLRSAAGILKDFNITTITLAATSTPEDQIAALESEEVFTFRTIDDLPSIQPNVVDILCGIVRTTAMPTLVTLSSAPTSTEKTPRSTTRAFSPLYSPTSAYFSTSKIVELPSLTPGITSALVTAPSEKQESSFPSTPATAFTTMSESTTAEFVEDRITPKVTTVAVSSRERDCSTLKLDLLILLQATDYFSKYGSEQMKTFANSLSRSFKFGKDDVLTSLLQFNMNILSEEEQNGFDFQYAKVRPLLTEAIFQTHLHGGSQTNPALALNAVMESHFTASNGARDGIRKAVVFVMGAKLKEDEVYEFNQAIHEAVRRRHSIFVVGIPEGRLDHQNTIDFLKALHQLPPKNKLFARNGFNDLSNRTMVNNLAEEICIDVPYAIPVITTTKAPTTTSTEIPTEYFTTTAVRLSTTLPTTTVKTLPREMCPNNIDLALVLDVTNLGDRNMGLLKEFLLLLLERFEVDENHTNIAIVTYGTAPQVEWRFSDEQSFASISKRIRIMENLGKITNTGAALQKASMLFEVARYHFPRVVALVTDARSKDDLSMGVMNLQTLPWNHDGGMKLVAIGLESASPGQLSLFADDNSVLYVDTYNDLVKDDTVGVVFDLLCQPYLMPTISMVTTPTVPEKYAVSTRITTIASTASTEICICYWTDFVNRQSPTINQPGDDESWAFSSPSQTCRQDYNAFDLQCQSSGGYTQSNVECSLNYPSPICHSFETDDGSACFDYLVSIRCCSPSCGEAPTPRPTAQKMWRCNERMDVVFAVDSTLTNEKLHRVKQFTGGIAEKMNFSQGHARSSIVTYGSNGSTISSSWTYDILQLKKSIDSIAKSQPGTSDVAKALKIIVEDISRINRPDSDSSTFGDIAKSLIVFVSGFSVGMVDGLVRQLESSKFQTIVVGLENPRRNLINRLASNSELVFLPKSTDELLNGTLEEVLNILCGLPATTTFKVESTTLVPITSAPEKSTIIHPGFTPRSTIFTSVALNTTKPAVSSPIGLTTLRTSTTQTTTPTTTITATEELKNATVSTTIVPSIVRTSKHPITLVGATNATNLVSAPPTRPFATATETIQTATTSAEASRTPAVKPSAKEPSHTSVMPTLTKEITSVIHTTKPLIATKIPAAQTVTTKTFAASSKEPTRKTVRVTETSSTSRQITTTEEAVLLTSSTTTSTPVSLRPASTEKHVWTSPETKLPTRSTTTEMFGTPTRVPTTEEAELVTPPTTTGGTLTPPPSTTEELKRTSPIVKRRFTQKPSAQTTVFSTEVATDKLVLTTTPLSKVINRTTEWSTETTRRSPSPTSFAKEITTEVASTKQGISPFVTITTATSTTRPIVTKATTPITTGSTTPFSGCHYYDDATHETRILEVEQVIYPKEEDSCFSLRCAVGNVVTLENKRLACERLFKPECSNRFEPILRYDDACNCQWECQCYCQASSTIVHTFDGMAYAVEGDCEQTLVQSSNRAAKSGRKFSVTMTKDRCGTSRCISEVTLAWDGDQLTFHNNKSVRSNGMHVAALDGRIAMDLVGEHQFLARVEEIGLVLMYEPIHNAIAISLPAYLWNEDTEGMCGTCNHDVEDDLMLRNGRITDNITDFVSDWTSGGECNITERRPCNQTKGNHCELIKSSSVFEGCRGKIDWGHYYHMCVEEGCRKPGADCEVVAIFAEACRHEGLCVDWRSENVCPLECSNGRLFKPCAVPPYERSCDKLPRARTLQKLLGISEGCFLECGEHETIINGSCVSEENCFKCFDEETKSFKTPSEVWLSVERKCHICACSERDLAVRCQEKTCEKEIDEPVCEVCEKVSIQANSDPCCPEYECACDYERCNPIVPSQACADGSIMSLVSDEGACQVVYNCTCEMERCSAEKVQCENPMVPTNVESHCCPKQLCLCPETCDDGVTECEVGYVKSVQADICNCSTVTCDAMPVCIIRNNNQSLIKIKEEMWTDPTNSCLSCTCVKQMGELYNVSCIDESSVCTRCPKGFKESYVQDKCCPSCVQDACIVVGENNTIAIYMVGYTWPIDECSNATCILDQNHPVAVDIKSECNKTFPSTCKFGFTLQCSTDPCCPDCQCVPDDVCIYNGSSLHIPGNNWTIAACTSCECTLEKQESGFNVHQCTTVSCDACEEGSVRRQLEETCCGECVPTDCRLSRPKGSGIWKVLKIGDEFRDNCYTYTCVEDSNGFAVVAGLNVTCPAFNQDECLKQGGSIGVDESRCCQTCKFDERECQVRMGSNMSIAVGNCTTDREISVPYCDGQCSSSATYRFSNDEFSHYCTCCKPVTYTNRTENATCTDGTKTQFTYRFITQCSCERVACTEWTTYKDNGEIISFKTRTGKHFQDTSKFLVSSWSSDAILSVVEISDVDASKEVDAASVLQQMVEKYGLQDLTFQFVRMSAKNSTLRESLMKVFSNTRLIEESDLTT